jgi:hypothetical protein
MRKPHIYIEIYLLSLFLPRTPAMRPDARVCVSACDRGERRKKVGPAHRYLAAQEPPDGGGNSLALFDSLFCKSGIYLRGPHSRATVRASCQAWGTARPAPRVATGRNLARKGRGLAADWDGFRSGARHGRAGQCAARQGKGRRSKRERIETWIGRRIGIIG